MDKNGSKHHNSVNQLLWALHTKLRMIMYMDRYIERK